MAFTGSYENVLDEKGRLMVPAKMRAEFGSEGVYVTQGLDGKQLMVLSSELFEKILDGISGSDPLSMFNPKVRKLQRLLITPSVKVEFDGSGRLTIPQRLRTHAGLEAKSNVLVLGVGPYVEIWNPEAYDEYLESDDESLSDLSASLFFENKESLK
jgi:Uncharacterized protein conserved in bacteria